MTEDFFLALKLTAAGLRGRYLPVNLAHGEAPEEVGVILQQRSRWCKGHMQLFFDRRECPIICPGLSLLQRVLFTNGTCARLWGARATVAE